jgi:hypothetical protein
MPPFNVLSSHRAQNTDKTSSTIARCLILLDILQSVGDMVPLVGGPLKGIGGLACKVITVVKVWQPCIHAYYSWAFYEHVPRQDIRTSREGCALLAEKTGRLALSILHEAIEAGPTMTSHMTARLERFYEHVSSNLVHHSQDNNLFLVQDAERDIRIYDKQTLPPNQVVR